MSLQGRFKSSFTCVDEGDLHQSEAVQEEEEESSKMLSGCKEKNEENSGNSNGARCLVCGKKFPGLELMRSHMQNQHNVNLKVEKKTKAQTGGQHSDDLNKCDTCDMVFVSEAELRKHRTLCVLYHGDYSAKSPQSTTCDICQRSYDSVKKLQTHQRVCHAEKDLECPHCDYTTKHAMDLKRHRLRKHGRPEDYPYQCPTCLKRFLLPTAYNKHLEIHQEERRLLHCEFEDCDYTTVSSSSLAAHVRKHKGEVRKFTCDVCGAVLGAQHTLNVHMRRHAGVNPFTCGMCHLAFPSNPQLSAHVKIHGEKTESCPVCGKLFLDKAKVRRHMSIHSDEKKYTCPWCPYKCNLDSNLRKHCQARHGQIYPPKVRQHVSANPRNVAPSRLKRESALRFARSVLSALSKTGALKALTNSAQGEEAPLFYLDTANNEIVMKPEKEEEDETQSMLTTTHAKFTVYTDNGELVLAQLPDTAENGSDLEPTGTHVVTLPSGSYRASMLINESLSPGDSVDTNSDNTEYLSYRFLDNGAQQMTQGVLENETISAQTNKLGQINKTGQEDKLGQVIAKGNQLVNKVGNVSQTGQVNRTENIEIVQQGQMIQLGQVTLLGLGNQIGQTSRIGQTNVVGQINKFRQTNEIRQENQSSRYTLVSDGSLVPTSSDATVSNLQIGNPLPFSTSLKEAGVWASSTQARAEQEPMKYSEAGASPSIVKQIVEEQPMFGGEGGASVVIGYEDLEALHEHIQRQSVADAMETSTAQHAVNDNVGESGQLVLSEQDIQQLVAQSLDGDMLLLSNDGVTFRVTSQDGSQFLQVLNQSHMETSQCHPSDEPTESSNISSPNQNHSAFINVVGSDLYKSTSFSKDQENVELIQNGANHLELVTMSYNDSSNQNVLASTPHYSFYTNTQDVQRTHLQVATGDVQTHLQVATGDVQRTHLQVATGDVQRTHLQVATGDQRVSLQFVESSSDQQMSSSVTLPSHASDFIEDNKVEPISVVDFQQYMQSLISSSSSSLVTMPTSLEDTLLTYSTSVQEVAGTHHNHAHYIYTGTGTLGDMCSDVEQGETMIL